MVQTVEPERSDPSGWIWWIAAVVTTLALALIGTMLSMGGDRTAGVALLVLGIAAFVMATLILPGWAVIVNDD